MALNFSHNRPADGFPYASLAGFRKQPSSYTSRLIGRRRRCSTGADRVYQRRRDAPPSGTARILLYWRSFGDRHAIRKILSALNRSCCNRAGFDKSANCSSFTSQSSVGTRDGDAGCWEQRPSAAVAREEHTCFLAVSFPGSVAPGDSRSGGRALPDPGRGGAGTHRWRRRSRSP